VVAPNLPNFLHLYRIGCRYGQVRDRFPKTMKRLEPAIDWVMRELALPSA